METIGREIFIQGLGGMIACECQGCGWTVATPFVEGEPARETAQREFDSHRCEDYPIGKEVVNG
jgi:hypothetical protein